jgi:hypothetical protein
MLGDPALSRFRVCRDQWGHASRVEAPSKFLDCAQFLAIRDDCDEEVPLRRGRRDGRLDRGL